jgi:hypothetical protein
MSIFGRLARALFGGSGGGRDSGSPAVDSAGGNAFWLYVKCNACGEKIRVRVNREHDLSADFGGGDTPSGYFGHKEIVGRNCFRRIKVDLHFDSRRSLVEQTIDGGTFITRQEYEAPDEPDAAAASSAKTDA